MNPVAAPPHVTLSGDLVGEYVVTGQRPDGELTLTPDRSRKAILARNGERPATPDELAAFEAEYGPFLPPDGEG